MKRLDFIYFDAGSGHRAAANALRQVIEREARPWDVRMVNLQEQLDQLDVFRKLTGFRLQDLYNLMLAKGWTLGSAQMVPFMHAVIRAFHGRQVEVLREFWKNSPPDLVVSLVPNFNRALGESLAAELPGLRLLTVLTDIADYPPHFWLEPVPQYIVCGSEKAVTQALSMGHPRDRICRVSGMILNPAFHDIPPLSPEERAKARAALGFDERPVGLVLFGGQGSPKMIEIARRLPDRQLLLICGHSRSVAAKLRSMRHGAPLHVEGFTREVPRLMQLADYFIGKPGPGSVSEALHMGLPAIVESNAWTLPQERYNPQWLRELGAGLAVATFRQIGKAVDELLAPESFARFHAATAKVSNRAVFEVVEVIERLLARSEAAAGCDPS